MNEETLKRIKELAEKWKNRTHIGRSTKERQAYADGVEDALTALFEKTRHGMYPGNTTAAMLNDLFDI